MEIKGEAKDEMERKAVQELLDGTVSICYSFYAGCKINRSRSCEMYLMIYVCYIELTNHLGYISIYQYFHKEPENASLYYIWCHATCTVCSFQDTEINNTSIYILTQDFKTNDSKYYFIFLAEAAARERDDELGEDAKYANMNIPMLMKNKVPEGYETDDKLDVSLRPNEVLTNFCTIVTVNYI